MRKTKIVCTMGPSTDKPGILRQLMENGMNVARFNFSHGDYEEHKGRFDKVRALSKELDEAFPDMEKSLPRLIKFLEILRDHQFIMWKDQTH